MFPVTVPHFNNDDLISTCYTDLILSDDDFCHLLPLFCRVCEGSAVWGAWYITTAIRTGGIVDFFRQNNDLFCFLDRAFSIMRTKINQQNAQINPELICAFCWFIFVLRIMTLYKV